MTITSTLRRGAAVVAVAATALAGGVLAAGPADAKAGRIIKSGTCSPAGTWKLKASPQNGRIEVEFEVHARSGQRWRVVVTDNGVTRVNALRTTVAGVFGLRAVVPNMRGTDVITARARNLSTGATCTGTLRF